MASGYTSILNALLFKEKPELPGLESINLGEEQQKSIKSNTAALPALESLASRVNEFTSSERLKALRNVIPGLDENIAKVMAGLGRGLEGMLPIEDRDQIWNSSTARAVGSGTGGLESGYGRALVERDLGLAKQDVFYKSLSAFDNWVKTGSTYLTGPQFDFTSAFISPMQQASFDVSERNTMWNYKWFKAQHDAQPEPWEAAVGGLMDWVANTSLSVAETYAGKLGAGGDKGGSQSVRVPTGSRYSGMWSDQFM